MLLKRRHPLVLEVDSPDNTFFGTVFMCIYYNVISTPDFFLLLYMNTECNKSDLQEILRRDWMFKLVGDEYFLLGKQQAKCELRVDPLPYFAFSYSLTVDGKPLEKFTENQSQSKRTWTSLVSGKRYRIIFDKQTLDLWVNGQSVESEDAFVDNGTEMRFQLDEGVDAIIKATSTDKKQGVIHELFVDGQLIDEEPLM